MSNDLFSFDNISFLLVFVEGLLSFFSPCVIPLLPVYMSYLAGNTKQSTEEGTILYKRQRVFFHTIFFVLGISFAFFILGFSFTKIGSFFQTNQLLFTRLGGILIMVLGLVQIGFLDFSFLQRERKIQLDFSKRNMNPLIAFLLGFTFSFAWTPCIGPALSSVLIMASGSSGSLAGNLLVLVYAIGFIIPFLLLGLFTTQTLNFLKKHQKLLKYTVKLGGLLLILIGFMTFTGWMNGVSRYLSRITYQSSQENNTNSSDTADTSDAVDNTDTSDTSDKSIGNEQTAEDTDSKTTSEENASRDSSEKTSEDNTDQTKEEKIPAYDFTLTDQYGTTHTLSDYKGKVVFLNFWATWCSPCQKEMPDIEELYQEYGFNEEDVIILGIANPSSEEYPKNSDVSKDEIIAFLDENSYTFPVLFDETGEILKNYYISAFPTTFLIDDEGNFYRYATGMLTKDIMKNVIQQTIDSTK